LSCREPLLNLQAFQTWRWLTPQERAPIIMACADTPFGGVKGSGYGREHAIQTLQEFGYTKMMRFPSGLGAIPSWRGVNEIFGPSGSEV
jgi:acyl-CoA reductase-like NAD-dependent aldehyde dehydrogenase